MDFERKVFYTCFSAFFQGYYDALGQEKFNALIERNADMREILCGWKILEGGKK